MITFETNEELELLSSLNKIDFKEYDKIKKAFNEFLNEDLNITIKYNNLIKFNTSQILCVLKEFDFNNIETNRISARINMIISILNNKEKIEFKKYLEENYCLKEQKEKPVIDINNKLSMTKDEYTDYKKNIENEIKIFNKELQDIKDYNTKLNSILEYLNNNSFENIFINENYDITDKPYIYFEVIDNNEILFIQNIINKKFDNIKRIYIEDCNIDSLGYSKKEVRLYFEDDNICSEFFTKNKNIIFSIYQLFLLKYKHTNGDFGIYNNKQPQTITEQKNIDFDYTDTSDFDIQKWNTNDIVINVSDCYFKIENDLFYFTPIKYYDLYKKELFNPRIFIIGVSDKNFWNKKDYGFYSEMCDAEDYLLNNYCKKLQ